MLKKELIFKIKRKIMEYESKMNSYKKSELEYLNRVPSIYDYTISFNDFKNFDLIYTGIILGNNYDDFESIKYSPMAISKNILFNCMSYGFKAK